MPLSFRKWIHFSIMSMLTVLSIFLLKKLMAKVSLLWTRGCWYSLYMFILNQFSINNVLPVWVARQVLLNKCLESSCVIKTDASKKKWGHIRVKVPPTLIEKSWTGNSGLLSLCHQYLHHISAVIHYSCCSFVQRELFSSILYVAEWGVANVTEKSVLTHTTPPPLPDWYYL